MYNVRTHNLRKFFRTQLSAAKIDDEIIKYMMGKTIDTYEDVQNLGIETLRNLYVAAGLAIRPKTKVNRIEQLKEIIRFWGENPEQILSKDVFSPQQPNGPNRRADPESSAIGSCDWT